MKEGTPEPLTDMPLKQRQNFTFKMYISFDKRQNIFNDYNYPVIKMTPLWNNAYLFIGNVQAEARLPLSVLSEEYSHIRYRLNFMSSEISYLCVCLFVCFKGPFSCSSITDYWNVGECSQ